MTTTCAHSRFKHRACADAHLDLFVCADCGFRFVTPRLMPRPRLRELKAALRMARAMRTAGGAATWAEVCCACRDAPYVAAMLTHAGFRVVVAEGSALLLARVGGRDLARGGERR